MDYQPAEPMPAALEGVGYRLRFARHHRAMRQTDLHQRSGVSKATINSVENDKRAPAIESVCKLAKALDVEPAWLAFGMEPSGLPNGDPTWSPYPSGDGNPNRVPDAERERRRALNQAAHAAAQRNGTAFDVERQRLRALAAQRQADEQRAQDEADSLAAAVDRYGFDFPV